MIALIVALHAIPIAAVLLYLSGVIKFHRTPPPQPEMDSRTDVVPAKPHAVAPHVVPPPVDPLQVVTRPKPPEPTPPGPPTWDLPPVLPPAGMSPLIISGADPAWPKATGKPLAPKLAPLIREFEMKASGPINAIAVLPTGKFVIAGGADQHIRAWDTATARMVKVFEGAPQVVRSLAVHPGGGAAASGGDDGSIRVWDLSNGREVFALTGHSGPVRSLAFSPNGMYILSGGQDGTIRVWDVQSKEAVRNIKLGQPVTSVAFCPDGRRGLVGGDSGTIALYDLEAAKQLHATTGHINAAITGLAFSPDGHECVSVGSDGKLRFWDVVTGARLPIGTPKGPSGIDYNHEGKAVELHAVAYAGDGSWVVATADPSTAGVVEPHGFGRARIDLPPLGRPLALAVAPDGSAVYIGTDLGAVRRMDFQGGPDFVDTHAGPPP